MITSPLRNPVNFYHGHLHSGEQLLDTVRQLFSLSDRGKFRNMKFFKVKTHLVLSVLVQMK